MGPFKLRAVQSTAGRQDAFRAVPETGKLGTGPGPARSPLTHLSRDSPLHHWNGCINEVKVGFPERTQTGCWGRRGCARSWPGWRRNYRRSQGLQRGRLAEQQRGKRRKQSLPQRSSADGNRERPGPGGQREGRDARPKRQQPGHGAGFGSHRTKQCALGFRKLTPSSAHPLPMNAPSREPAPCSSPALWPMGSLLLPLGIIYRPVPSLEEGAFFFAG